jgi:hypothetical protein
MTHITASGFIREINKKPPFALSTVILNIGLCFLD